VAISRITNFLHLAGDGHREGVDELPAARDGGVAFGERVG
jgi:hypothetical protein